MFKTKLSKDSPIPKFIHLKIQRRDGVESLTILEEGEFKVPIDDCINSRSLGFNNYTILWVNVWDITSHLPLSNSSVKQLLVTCILQGSIVHKPCNVVWPCCRQQGLKTDAVFAWSNWVFGTLYVHLIFQVSSSAPVEPTSGQNEDDPALTVDTSQITVSLSPKVFRWLIWKWYRSTWSITHSVPVEG